MKTISLRSVLGLSVAASLGAALLSGCGGDEKYATGNGNAATNQTGNQATAQPDGAPAQTVNRVEPPSTPGKYGGTLTDSTISDPKSFNIWVSAESSTSAVVGSLYDTLIGRNSYTLGWEGRLAELPVISKDGLTWTFKLKPNLKWSDGQPLDADDILFSLNMIYDPKTEGIIRESMLVEVTDSKTKKTQRVPLKYRKLDGRTIEFTFPVPYAPARDMLSFPVAPRHKLEAAWKAGKINSTWGVNTSPSELVSCGPWIMQSYVPGQRIVYNRNPNYWEKDKQGRPLPYLEHYVLLIVPDLNTETIKFLAGDTDTLGVQLSDYPLVKKAEAKSANDPRRAFQVNDLGPGWGFSYLGFNLNPNSSTDKNKIKLFQEVKFRRAVSYAINRESMSKNLFVGLARPLYSPETPANVAFYNPDVPKYAYDPAQSKALLDEIGARDSDGDGVREWNGKPIKFNIITNVENSTRKAMATVITRDLKQIGLNATFTPINFNKIISMLDVAPYPWEAVVLGFTGGAEPYNGASIWFSSGLQHQWNPKQKTPGTPWEAEIDQLWREGARTLDEKKRKAIYDKWQVIAAEQLPFIFTVVPNSVIAIRRDKFGNLKPVSGGGVLWNLEELYDLKATRDAP